MALNSDLYGDPLDGVGGEGGGMERAKGPLKFMVGVAFLLSPPSNRMSDWRLKLHIQFGFANCIARCRLLTAYCLASLKLLSKWDGLL